MNNYKLMIQYDGGRYKGWQRLGDGHNTIQGKIENVLSEMVGEKIEIIGCSRTDAGVHAYAQVANFKLNKKLPEVEIKNYLNKYLPQDICITEVISVEESFHARYNAKSKTYIYRIWNGEDPNPFERKYSMHIEKKLYLPKMIKASQYFIGPHDFTAFSNAKSKKKSMVRDIYSISIEEKDRLIQIRVCGNGFLHNMVRKIVGVLIAAGLGEVEVSKVSEIIEAKERIQIAWLADACGLYLEKVEF